MEVQAQGLRASVLQRVVGIEGELRRFVAGYVRRELDKPHVREARLIDVSRAIDQAWASPAPAPRADGVTADLNEELEREIVTTRRRSWVIPRGAERAPMRSGLIHRQNRTNHPRLEREARSGLVNHTCPRGHARCN